MSQNPIFLPMGVLAFWTFAILLLVPFQRFRAVFAGKVGAKDYKYGKSDDASGDLSIPDRAMMNLLELPVLFYVVCLMFYVTNRADAVVLEVCWAYVVFRIAQTLVHVTYNKVIHRLTMFAISNFVLISLWGMFFLR